MREIYLASLCTRSTHLLRGCKDVNPSQGYVYLRFKKGIYCISVVICVFSVYQCNHPMHPYAVCCQEARDDIQQHILPRLELSSSEGEKHRPTWSETKFVSRVKTWILWFKSFCFGGKKAAKQPVRRNAMSPFGMEIALVASSKLHTQAFKFPSKARCVLFLKLSWFKLVDNRNATALSLNATRNILLRR